MRLPTSARTNCSPHALAHHHARPQPQAASGFGAPNSIKGPTEAVFHRQSGSHLLVVGQREDDHVVHARSLSLVSLGRAVSGRGLAKFVFLHAAAPSPDERFLDGILQRTGHEVRIVRGHELSDAMSELARTCASAPVAKCLNAPPVFIFIAGLHKFKKLKSNDDTELLLRQQQRERTEAGRATHQPDHGRQHAGRASDRVARQLQQRHALPQSQVAHRVRDASRVPDERERQRQPHRLPEGQRTLGLHRALLHNEQAGTGWKPSALMQSLIRSGSSLSANKKRAWLPKPASK